MKVDKLDARRIDRVDVEIRLGFDGNQDWEAHALLVPPHYTNGAEIRLMPESLNVTWNRSTGEWTLVKVVAVGFQLMKGLSALDGPSTHAVIDVGTAPEWVRQLAEQYSPNNEASPLRHRGLGDLR